MNASFSSSAWAVRVILEVSAWGQNTTQSQKCNRIEEGDTEEVILSVFRCSRSRENDTSAVRVVMLGHKINFVGTGVCLSCFYWCVKLVTRNTNRIFVRPLWRLMTCCIGLPPESNATARIRSESKLQWSFGTGHLWSVPPTSSTALSVWVLHHTYMLCIFRPWCIHVHKLILDPNWLLFTCEPDLCFSSHSREPDVRLPRNVTTRHDTNKCDWPTLYFF